MGLLYGFLILVEMLVSALLIVVIFMQKSKGGMGGSAFGGGGAGEAIFGSRMGNVLTKATVVLGVIFLFNTLVLTVMTSRRGPGGSGSVMEGAGNVPTTPPASQQMPTATPGNDGGNWMEGELEPDVQGLAPMEGQSDSAGTGMDISDDVEDVMVVEPVPAEDVMVVEPESSETDESAASSVDNAEPETSIPTSD